VAHDGDHVRGGIQRLHDRRLRTALHVAAGRNAPLSTLLWRNVLHQW
jgi:hypothetical protein